MLEMNYITRGNSSPSGKARLYFCCHPEDLDMYLDTISDDIFSHANCAIWYTRDAENGQDQDQHLFDLEQMQLFVIPVTKRFLTEPSAAFDIERPFAYENNIPVLYILVESGLDMLFMRKIGELQYLSRLDTDPTSVPYPEKLRKYIESVIVRDDVHERIRDAFDAYIFMSYRKKDRSFAQKLMKLIHEKESCERIAIWYDEFLVPGENFNSAIEKAIDDSSLFTMVVTPNLVNEENYVINIEYPMAYEKGKHILPVEMVTTDPDELTKRFPDIPSVISPVENEQLHKAILDALPEALKTDKSDPLHTFLVGLAFLDGIDVEVNRERGVELINEAADCGCDEAIRKLVDIHMYGIGVPVDMRSAIKRQRELAHKYAEKADSTMEESDVVLYLRELLRLGDIAYQAKDFDTASLSFDLSYKLSKKLAFGAFGKSVWKKAKTFFSKYAGKHEFFDEVLYYMGYSCRMMLKTNDAMGEQDFENWAQKSEILAGLLAQYPENISFTRECLDLYQMLGKLCCDSGNIAGGEKAINKAISGWETLLSTDNDMRTRYGLVNMLNTRSDLSCIKGEFAEAYKDLERSFKVLADLNAEFPDNTNIHLDIIDCHLRLAKVCLLVGEDRRITEYYIDRVKEFIEFEEYKGNSDLLKNYKSRYMMLAGAFWDDEQSLSLYEEAYKLFSEEAESLYEADDSRGALEACVKIGRIYSKKGDHINANNWLEKAREHIEELAATSRSIRDTRLLSDCYEELLRNAAGMGREDKVTEWYTKGVFWRKGLVQSTNSQYDKNQLEQLRALKEDLEINRTEQQPTFLDYMRDSKAPAIRPDRVREMELTISEAMREFALTHPYFDCTPISKMADLIEKDQDHDTQFILSGEITEKLLDHYVPNLMFEEEALIIMAYCGYYNLKNAKHVIGGKSKAIDDFHSFIYEMALWKKPVSEIKYLETWDFLITYIIKNQ